MSLKDVRIDCTRKVQCLMLDRMNASTQTQTIRINVRTEQEQVDLGAALGQGPGTSTDRSLLGCSRGKRRCALPSPFLFRENWQSNYRSDQLLKGSLLHFAYLPGRILCGGLSLFRLWIGAQFTCQTVVLRSSSTMAHSTRRRLWQSPIRRASSMLHGLPEPLLRLDSENGVNPSRSVCELASALANGTTVADNKRRRILLDVCFYTPLWTTFKACVF